MTFEELKAIATEQKATYVCQLDMATRCELLIMASDVYDDMPWWEQDELTTDTVEEELLDSKVADLDELFERYWELQAHEFMMAIHDIVNNAEASDKLEGYLSRHFEVWVKKYANTPENLIGELKHFAK